MALFCQIICQSLQQHRPVSVACSTAVPALQQQNGALTEDTAKLTAQKGTADWPAHDHAWTAGYMVESLQGVRATPCGAEFVRKVKRGLSLSLPTHS